MSRGLYEALVMVAGLFFPISACYPVQEDGDGQMKSQGSVLDAAARSEAADPRIEPAARRIQRVPTEPRQVNRDREQLAAVEPQINAAADEAAGAKVDIPAVPAAVDATAEVGSGVVVSGPTEPEVADPPAPPESALDPGSAPATPDAPAGIELAPEKDLLQLRLADLQKQNEELARRLKKLEQKVDRLEDNTSHETLGFGLGLASGLKEAKGEYRFVMEANLRYVFACLYARNGVCGGLAANLRIWDIQLHWIGVGVMYYGGYGDDRALSVPEFGRKLDLMLTSGLDWRIWNGLEIRAQVAWFIPPPGPIYDKAKERIERAVDEVSVENPIPDKKAPKEAWDIVVDAYERAFRSPYLVIGVRWEF